VGLFAALWVKLLGGMGGLPVDLLSLNEYAFNARLLAERFSEANSLETLRLLLAPFAEDRRGRGVGGSVRCARLASIGLV